MCVGIPSEQIHNTYHLQRDGPIFRIPEPSGTHLPQQCHIGDPSSAAMYYQGSIFRSNATPGFNLPQQCIMGGPDSAIHGANNMMGPLCCIAAEDGSPMLHCCGRWDPDVALLPKKGPRCCIAAEDRSPIMHSLGSGMVGV